LMKVEAINETLTVLVKIAMQKVNPKVKVWYLTNLIRWL
jgi:hypothetical protein